jgi:hypothetical protein
MIGTIAMPKTRPDDPLNTQFQHGKVLGERLKQTAGDVNGLLCSEHPDQTALSAACDANKKALAAVLQFVRDAGKRPNTKR